MNTHVALSSSSAGRASAVAMQAALSLLLLARIQREPVDPVAIRTLAAEEPCPVRAEKFVSRLVNTLGLPQEKWSRSLDPAYLPQIVVSGDNRWGVVRGRDAAQNWIVARPDDAGAHMTEHAESQLPGDSRFLRMRFRRRAELSKSPVVHLVTREIFSSKARIVDVVAGSAGIYVLALASSLYSMQVYDRVIPSSAYATLLTLTIGVSIAIALEAFGKISRARTLDQLSDAVDQRLARSVYTRFLGIRLDRLPGNVGAVAQRMRSYEAIRSFIVNAGSQVIIDLPICALFLLVMVSISHWLALIPAVFFVFCVSLGMTYRARLERSAIELVPTTHLKTSLLVESVEGAETIKSAQGGWRMLSRWLEVTDSARQHELYMRNISTHSQYMVGAMQQVCYVAVVAFGAILVGRGELSFGGLIASSILSGRILQPTSQIPSTIIQWSHAKAAVVDLDDLWSLDQDEKDGSEALVLERVSGELRLDEVIVKHDDYPVCEVRALLIKPGERVAILGSVGSGKTTLLRLLSGMYKPTAGHVTLDGVDIARVAKTTLGSIMGYVPQDGHLFAGTLRENLIFGLTDPGDDAILAMAKRSGLFDVLIRHDPNGLDRPIREGGAGLSGGQRQLVHVTRVMLRQPRFWLLDEPTASMDGVTENVVLAALRDALADHPQSTLCVVTHKPKLLNLVDRVIVMSRGKIVLDGPRDDVMKKLQA